MSIESKSLLLDDLRRGLSSVLTASDLDRALSAASDALAAYDVARIPAAADAPDDLLDAYLSALRVQGRSPKTLERYRYILGRLLASAAAPARLLTVYHLRRHLADEQARGISDRTLEGERQVYSAFFGWLHREGLLDRNPAANLGPVKYQKQIKTCYSEVDVERLKMAASTPRDRAIIAFLSATGCRVSEMTRLDRQDVDLLSRECRVLGKGNKQRLVYLSPVACMSVRDYLSTRQDAHPALFLNRLGERLTPGGVRRMLASLGAAASVSHVHPHKFRRTLATGLIRHGMPIQEVAAILGHDKIDTTMQYVVLDQSELKHNYQKFA